MELMTFDFKTLLFSLVFFFSTCAVNKPVSITAPEATPLILPKEEGGETYDSVDTKLTLILFGNDKIYAYEGKDISTGSYYGPNTIRERIKRSQKKFAKKNFVVVIKPIEKATYKNTVEVLDEMTINNISKYAMVELTQQEKQSLKIAN